MAKTKNFYFISFFLLSSLLLLGCVNLDGIFSDSKNQSNSIQEVKAKSNLEEINKELENFSQPQQEQKEPQPNIEPEQKVIEKTSEQPTQSQKNLQVQEIEKPLVSKQLALKIFVLKKDEKAEIDNWEIELKNIYNKTGDFLPFFAVYLDKVKVAEFEVNLFKATKLSFPNGKEYILIVSNPYMGKPISNLSAAMLEVYNVKDIKKSDSDIKIGAIQLSYALKGMFPPPQKLISKELNLFEKIDIPNNIENISVSFSSLDKEIDSFKAELVVSDSKEREVGRIKLSNKQLFEITLYNKEKYAVYLEQIYSDKGIISVSVYKILSFQNP